MFKNEVIDRYNALYYAEFEKKCTGLHISIADLNIGHCV